jgi:small-conductance mechanosensitive channel
MTLAALSGKRLPTPYFAGLLAGLLLVPMAWAQDAPSKPAAPAPALEEAIATAPVEVDGEILFRVRGASALPAEKRAGNIAARIVGIARDRNFQLAEVRAEESEHGTSIMAGKTTVMVVVEADAKLESVSRQVLATLYQQRIRQAITDYRAERTPDALGAAVARTLAATVILALLAALVVWLARRGESRLKRLYERRLEVFQGQTLRILRLDRAWEVIRGTIGVARSIGLLVLAIAYAQYVLVQFPATRGAGTRMLGYVLGPLESMGRGFVGIIPDLIVLVIIYFIARYGLVLLRLYFDAVERGTLAIDGFDPEWAQPTYKLLRAVAIVFALVVAYPYVPGSGSDAFKGISIFIGVVFSLGSSSAVSNIIAGYMMTYRRAFRLGDRVKIGGFTGDVTAVRLQVTHLKTFKNEEVIVPNSSVLNSEVINYSTLARTTGLILHTTVGIGYETPWRQVEGMLLEAARRTAGLNPEPAPFVRELALGDFCVTYELNAYCGDAQAMNALYAAMHRQILDVFNEYGVQIMTPAYEGDPPEPKVVPKDKWFTPPAKPESR